MAIKIKSTESKKILKDSQEEIDFVYLFLNSDYLEEIDKFIIKIVTIKDGLPIMTNITNIQFQFSHNHNKPLEEQFEEFEQEIIQYFEQEGYFIES